ncbi:Tetratricopeptide TPR_2 repeat protein [Chthoniobacter flavus Ellin428]|uniref:Tetratricopeptide TPR_2 repeat protein n=2 Tax=Chthoniobacter flavus TaxID=191863 RepID=B4DC44_9BACT|nr:Tetratricopeptide TPR_2 repeat protein [Chthoniobacter flavus Ellin428]TCO85275.1 tetratricopeptide repeat protein [Chthoniobacter flavus]
MALNYRLPMRLLRILAFTCCLQAWSLLGAAPLVPAELQLLAREGKERFEHGDYFAAERTYRKILAQAPNNLYAQDDLPAPQGSVSPGPPVMRVVDAPASSSSPGIPPAMQAQANEARQAFEKGDYRKAEGIYREILKTAPDNLSVLSNLGVVLFRQKKLKEAEDCFTKAIAIEPVDGFAHCTLGIVYYTQGKYDVAISELNKAIAVDGKNATAHNYLGVTWSQKGHQEQAQREFETAIALDPNYADADYNLAVLLATKSSPDMEKARQYYQQARKLGAEADPALERLMGQKGANNAPAKSLHPVVKFDKKRSGFGDFYTPQEMDWMRRYSLAP